MPLTRRARSIVPLLLVAGVASIAACGSSDGDAPNAFENAGGPRGGGPGSVAVSQSGPDRRRGDALAKLEASTSSRWDAGFDRENGRARLLVGRAALGAKAATATVATKRFVAENADLFDVAASDLELERERSADGRTIVSLARKVAGLRVVGDYVNAAFEGDDLVDVQANLSGAANASTVTPAIFELDEARAHALARDAIRAEGADPAMVAVAKVSAERVRYANEALSPAFEVTVDFEAADQRMRVVVDAKSGALLEVDLGEAHEQYVNARARDARGDSRVVEVKQIYVTANNQPNQFSLVDKTASNSTGRCNRLACPTALNPFDAEAVSAHANARAARDAFQNVFKHQLSNIESRVNYNGPLPWSSATDNASFKRGVLSGGWLDYNVTSPGDQYTTAATETVAHEYTHGVTAWSSALVYERESGALNESLSDVFAIFVKEYAQHHGYIPSRHAYGHSGFYGYGSLSTKTGAVYRSLSDPGGAPNPLPAHVSQKIATTGSCSGDNDHCGVHSNSSIPNHAFYLAAEGGTNRVSRKGPRRGIGRQNAWTIWHAAGFSSSLGARATFADFAKLTISKADQWAGSDNSLLGHSVNCAWQAVGVNVYGNDACRTCNAPGNTSWTSTRSAGAASGAIGPRNTETSNGTCSPAARHPSASRAGTLAVGASSCSSVRGAETSDWYRIDARKDVPIVLRLQKVTGDADLELYDGAGNVLATSAFTGTRDELIDVTPDKDDALFVRVTSLRSVDSTFELSLGSVATESGEVEACADLPDEPIESGLDCGSGGAACAAGLVCSWNGEGHCCRNPIPIPDRPGTCDAGTCEKDVCFSDGDCADDSMVCALANNDGAAAYTCVPRGTEACVGAPSK